MFNFKSMAVGAGLVGALGCGFATVSAQAAPLVSGAGVFKAAAADANVTDVRYRGGGRGYYGGGYRGGYRGGYYRGGYGFGAAPLIAGALLGAGIAAPYYYDYGPRYYRPYRPYAYYRPYGYYGYGGW